VSEPIPAPPPRATLGAMTLPPYLRGPALALACLALACVLCAAAWAQAPDLAPAAAVVADPIAATLPPGSPWWAGALLAVVGAVVAAARWAAGLVERRLAADDASRAAYRQGIEGRLATVEREAVETRLQLALTRQALQHVRDTLRAAADD
jgi:hypothetical protein